MTAVIARILLRYIAGALVLKGLLPDELGNTIVTDPDIISITEVIVGAAIGAAVEGWYSIAKRMGWST